MNIYKMTLPNVYAFRVVAKTRTRALEMLGEYVRPEFIKDHCKVVRLGVSTDKQESLNVWEDDVDESH